MKKAGKAGRKTGTKITFKPDETIFTVTEFNYDTLAQRLREMAFLNGGLKIILTDERDDGGKSQEFHFEGGVSEFVGYLNRGKQPLHANPIHIADEKPFGDDGGTLAMEVSLQYNNSYQENIYTFANTINTVGGGTQLA